MEIDNKELFFERAYSNEALSSFNCGVREIDQLIHKRSEGLNDYIKDENYESFIVYVDELPVAVFVYGNGILQTNEGDFESIEIEFIAVREEYRGKHIGTKIIEKIEETALKAGIHFLKVGAFFNKKYSAEEFYIRNHFEQLSDKSANIIPMFKEIDEFQLI